MWIKVTCKSNIHPSRCQGAVAWVVSDLFSQPESVEGRAVGDLPQLGRTTCIVFMNSLRVFFSLTMSLTQSSPPFLMTTFHNGRGC